MRVYNVQFSENCKFQCRVIARNDNFLPFGKNKLYEFSKHL